MPDPRDLCLQRRLLFAARESYHEPGEAAEPVGWLAPPLRISRLYEPGAHAAGGLFRVDPVDRALVGRVPEGVLVAFRGTLPPEGFGSNPSLPALAGWGAIALDWLNDVDVRPFSAGHYPGRVHSGFAGSLDRLWNDDGDDSGLRSAVAAMLDDGGPRRLYLTGHSKGGALAVLAAWRARQEWGGDLPVRIVTIAGARAGDQAFADAFAAADLPCRRYEVADDVVPRLPPGRPDPEIVVLLQLLGITVPRAAFEYASVGEPMEKPLGWWDRLRARLGGSLDPRRALANIVDAHSLELKRRYDVMVCQKSCRHDWH